MSLDSYDKWKLDTPDNHLNMYCECDQCETEIYEGEEYYVIDGDNIHQECFYEYCRDRLNPIMKVAGEDETD